MSQSISEGLLDGFRNGRSLGDIFLNELKAQFAKTVLQPLISPIVQAGNDALGGILKGGGGSLAALFGGGGSSNPLAGNYVNSMDAMSDAAGGGIIDSIGSFFSGLKFEGGGYTGNGLRAGGLDGKGGFMAMLHPQETVVDHAKGQKVSGGGTVVNNYTFGSGVSRSEVVAGMQQVLAQARTDRVEDGRRRRG